MRASTAASAGGRHRRALRWALGLVSGFLLLEVLAALADGVLLLGLAGYTAFVCRTPCSTMASHGSGPAPTGSP